MAQSTDRDVLRDEVTGPMVPPDYGDLVRLLNPRGEVKGFWVMGRRGLLDAEKVPPSLGRHGLDWEAAWANPTAEANALLRACFGVDPRRLVLAAADCAEAALPFIAGRETRPRAALDVARAWAREGSSSDEVRRAVAEAYEAYEEAVEAATGDVDTEACYAVYAAVAGAGAPKAAASYGADAADFAARAVAEAAPGNYLGVRLATRRAFSGRVRAWVPLPVVLLGRAKEPTPLDLGF